MILVLLMFNTYLMMKMKHPLSMGMMIMMNTLLIIMMTGMLNTFWFSYILFLIIIGSLMILFIYMTSIASNEKFYIKTNWKPITFIVIMTLTMNFNLLNKNILPSSSNQNLKMILNKFINFPNNMILIMIIMYLLITFIATIKITNFKKGPLRQNQH